MTVAICISCGATKFGAWVGCHNCGFQPDNPIDKAKSLLLTDHYLEPSGLNSVSALIRHKADPPLLHSLNLAKLIGDMAEEDYVSSYLNGTTLPCMECGIGFSPKGSEVSCPACMQRNLFVFQLCHVCNKVFLTTTQFCESCGRRLDKHATLSARVIGREVGVLVGSLASSTLANWQGQTPIGQLFLKLPLPGQREAAWEFETFAMYESSISMRELFPSLDFVAKAVRTMFSLYEQWWTLEGADPKAAEELVIVSARKFDKYDKIHQSFGEDILAVGHAAFQTIFGRKMEPDLGLTVEWNTHIGLIYKSVREFLQSTLFVRISRATD